MHGRASAARVRLRANPKQVTVRCAGVTLAESSATLTCEEQGLAPVVYVPRGDVRMELLERTAHHSHCPHKGDASYFSAVLREGCEENIAWSYEAPLPQVADLRERIAFDAERVELWQR